MSEIDSLLTPVADKLHPSFKKLISASELLPAVREIERAWKSFPAKDLNFVKQFQTSGFDARTFELYISQILLSDGFQISQEQDQPDFLADKDGLEVCLECTTSSLSVGGLTPYKPMNKSDADLGGLAFRVNNEYPIKIGSPLYSKLTKLVGGKHYWELEHVAGKPFVLAIQAFYEDGSLGFSSSGIANYLYGMRQLPAWDKDGSLIIETKGVSTHNLGDKEIPSGFFNLPLSKNISAILWSNAGTIPKFWRMGYGEEDRSVGLRGIRHGNCYNADPNAHAPLPFIYEVGSEDAPEETWGLEAQIFHNPSAKIPLPFGAFENVNEGLIDDGVYSDYLKSSFSPFSSLTSFIENNDEAAYATTIASAQAYLSMAAKLQGMKEDSPFWKKMRE